jgi:hypothetical protein
MAGAARPAQSFDKCKHAAARNKRAREVRHRGDEVEGMFVLPKVLSTRLKYSLYRCRHRVGKHHKDKITAKSSAWPAAGIAAAIVVFSWIFNFSVAPRAVSHPTRLKTGTCLGCRIEIGREPTMRHARPRASSHGDGSGQREPVDAQSVSTAVQVAAAWLIAFACMTGTRLDSSIYTWLRRPAPG